MPGGAAEAGRPPAAPPSKKKKEQGRRVKTKYRVGQLVFNYQHIRAAYQGVLLGCLGGGRWLIARPDDTLVEVSTRGKYIELGVREGVETDMFGPMNPARTARLHDIMEAWIKDNPDRAPALEIAGSEDESDGEAVEEGGKSYYPSTAGPRRSSSGKKDKSAPVLEGGDMSMRDAALEGGPGETLEGAAETGGSPAALPPDAKDVPGGAAEIVGAPAAPPGTSVPPKTPADGAPKGTLPKDGRGGGDASIGGASRRKAAPADGVKDGEGIKVPHHSSDSPGSYMLTKSIYWLWDISVVALFSWGKKQLSVFWNKGFEHMIAMFWSGSYMMVVASVMATGAWMGTSSIPVAMSIGVMALLSQALPTAVRYVATQMAEIVGQWTPESMLGRLLVGALLSVLGLVACVGLTADAPKTILTRKEVKVAKGAAETGVSPAALSAIRPDSRKDARSFYCACRKGERDWRAKVKPSFCEFCDEKAPSSAPGSDDDDSRRSPLLGTSDFTITSPMESSVGPPVAPASDTALGVLAAMVADIQAGQVRLAEELRRGRGHADTEETPAPTPTPTLRGPDPHRAEGSDFLATFTDAFHHVARPRSAATDSGPLLPMASASPDSILAVMADRPSSTATEPGNSRIPPPPKRVIASDWLPKEAVHLSAEELKIARVDALDTGRRAAFLDASMVSVSRIFRKGGQNDFIETELLQKEWPMDEEHRVRFAAPYFGHVLANFSCMEAHSKQWMTDHGMGDASVAKEHLRHCETVDRAIKGSRSDVVNTIEYEYIARRLGAIERAHENCKKPGDYKTKADWTIANMYVNDLHNATQRVPGLERMFAKRLQEKALLKKHLAGAPEKGEREGST